MKKSLREKSERGGHPVLRKPMKQWMLKITKYAERLLADLDDLDWPEGIKEMQRNWIGKSEGAEVSFSVENTLLKIIVFTTRPDTLFGATYMVLAPEHPLVDQLTENNYREEVQQYKEKAATKSDFDRIELNTQKTGAFTGAFALNPVNDEKIPIWVSDYVMMGYGTGAIMAVPAHDPRDFEFAQKFGIEIRAILKPDSRLATKEGVSIEDVLHGRACWAGPGILVNSKNDRNLDLNNLEMNDAKKTVINWLTKNNLGKATINYKLRDWLFSRQRYWGEPFPVIHMDDGEIRLVDENELPVRLPELKDFKPTGTGESPLAKAEDWLNYTDPKTGKQGRRETHTMPQWAGSCWYYLRFIDPANEKDAWDDKKEKYWMPVDLYVGGAEHAVLHLLYARFWHKVLFDLGYVSTREPFQKLINQGMILGISYKDSRGALVRNDFVEEKDEKFFHKDTGEELTQFPAKMSKALRNVVNPDEIIEEYGADSFRLYEMFMGPLEAVKPWNTQGVEGVRRFLQKSWRMIIGSDGKLTPEIGSEPLQKEQQRLLHATIKKVTNDLESMNMNTAISQLMIFCNEYSKIKKRNRETIETFVKLLSPLAPHIAEELWNRLGHDNTIAYEPWPVYKEAYIKEDETEILIQILGKPKVRIKMANDISPQQMEQIALANEEVKAAMHGRPVIKVVCVPGRLVNIVVK